MRHPSASSLLFLAVGLSACGEVTGLPSAEPIPVLQGLLIAGASRHLLQIEWSNPADVPYEPAPRPVDSAVVDLWLSVPAGDSVRYTTTGVPGQFAVVATIDVGRRYRLSGTIAGRVVTAQVNVPGALVVLFPAGDTLRIPVAAGFPRLGFEWRAESAGSYQALLVRSDGTTEQVLIQSDGDAIGLVDITPDSVGVLVIFAPPPEAPDTARLLIFGYDPSATAFFSSTTKGNVHGAFGLFGAAAKAEKVFVWE